MNNIFEYANLFASNVWLYGGTFLLVLGILVFVHEGGHYLVARWCGVKVETFSIGFGPEIFGFFDKAGTRWKFSLCPLGGYVKLFGDADPASASSTDMVQEGEIPPRPMTSGEREVAFFSQPVWKRSAIVFAGPAINLIFAVIVLSGLYMFYGKPVTPPIVTAIVSESAADKAGFLPGDEILSINGRKITKFEEVRLASMIALDTPMDITVMRDGKVLDIVATPEKVDLHDRFGFRHSRGVLGIMGALGSGNAFAVDKIRSINGVEFKKDEVDAVRSTIIKNLDRNIVVEIGYSEDHVDTLVVHPLSSMNEGLRDPDSDAYNAFVVDQVESDDFIKFGVFDGIKEAVSETYAVLAGSLEAMGQMITGVRSVEELGGIIRIGAMAGDMASSGFIALVSFTALLSINLGLINLFPIPMLDGGHLVFYMIEAVKGSPISEQIQEYAFRLGLAILVGIMLFANINDVIQLIQ